MPERPQTPKLVILDGEGTLYEEDAELPQQPERWHEEDRRRPVACSLRLGLGLQVGLL